MVKRKTPNAKRLTQILRTAKINNIKGYEKEHRTEQVISYEQHSADVYFAISPKYISVLVSNVFIFLYSLLQ